MSAVVGGSAHDCYGPSVLMCGRNAEFGESRGHPDAKVAVGRLVIAGPRLFQALRHKCIAISNFCIRPVNLWRTLWQRQFDFLLSDGRSGRIRRSALERLKLLVFFMQKLVVYSCCVPKRKSCMGSSVYGSRLLNR
jgi:hypothetical protein